MKPPEETGAPAPSVPPVKIVSASELLIDLPAAPPPTAAPPPADDPRRQELDSLNRPFDPAKFRYEKDSVGRWKNLKGGRKKVGAPASTPSAAPVPEIGPEDAPAPGGAPSPEATPGDTTPPPAPGAAAPRTDATLSPDAGGNMLARLLYGFTGWFTGDRKAAAATGEEHKSIASTFGAYLSFRGVAFVGALALLGTLALYFLDERRSESVGDGFKRRFGSKKTPPGKPGDDAKRAEPTAEPVTVPAVQSSGPAPVHFPE